MEYSLLSPCEEMQESYMHYYSTWLQTGTPFTPWASGLRGMSYADWLNNIEKRRTDVQAPQVASSLFAFCGQNSEIYGFFDLRHSLNSFLAKTGGHIGYGIHPLHRRKGLAPKMLLLGLDKAAEIGHSKVLITCYKDNIPSKKTIERAGGIFESETNDPDGRIVLRYWVATAAN